MIYEFLIFLFGVLVGADCLAFLVATWIAGDLTKIHGRKMLFLPASGLWALIHHKPTREGDQ